MELHSIISLATLVALISLIVLIFMAIKSLGKANMLMDDIKYKTDKAEKDIREIKDAGIETLSSFNELIPKLEEALDELKDLKSKSIESLQNTDDTMDIAKIALNNVNNKIEKIDSIIYPFEALARNFYNKVADPINTSTKVLGAVFKAASVFTSKFKK
jgi:uncharacterized protein YoxC